MSIWRTMTKMMHCQEIAFQCKIWKKKHYQIVAAVRIRTWTNDVCALYSFKLFDIFDSLIWFPFQYCDWLYTATREYDCQCQWRVRSFLIHSKTKTSKIWLLVQKGERFLMNYVFFERVNFTFIIIKYKAYTPVFKYGLK